MKGKQLSHLSKILAVLIVFVVLVINAVCKSVIVPINDAIKTALFIALIFSPIDISIWIKTFFESFGIHKIKIPENSNKLNDENEKESEAIE